MISPKNTWWLVCRYDIRVVQKKEDRTETTGISQSSQKCITSTNTYMSCITVVDWYEVHCARKLPVVSFPVASLLLCPCCYVVAVMSLLLLIQICLLHRRCWVLVVALVTGGASHFDCCLVVKYMVLRCLSKKPVSTVLCYLFCPFRRYRIMCA
jgi:hypothetical protein